MDQLENFRSKVQKIRTILQAKKVDGVEINSQINFGFLTRGRGFIGLASVVSCGTLIITQDQICLIAENIEADRLYQEQLQCNPDIQVYEYPWYMPKEREKIVDAIMDGGQLVSENEIALELFRIRCALSDYDIEDYKNLSIEAASVLETTAMKVRKGVQSYALAGELSKQLWAHNIEPITILVAFDQRALQFRHPVLVEETLENYALISICGRRNGLVASLTRNVLLKHDSVMEEKHRKCAMIEAAMISELKVGNGLNAVFEAGVQAYKEQKYENEYQLHHQGGLTGFAPRENRASFDVVHTVGEHEAYAFNPTIQGAKCEEMLLVQREGVKIISHTGQYVYERCEVHGEIYILPTVMVVE